jgi:hypothetical protein
VQRILQPLVRRCLRRQRARLDCGVGSAREQPGPPCGRAGDERAPAPPERASVTGLALGPRSHRSAFASTSRKELHGVLPTSPLGGTQSAMMHRPQTSELKGRATHRQYQ